MKLRDYLNNNNIAIIDFAKDVRVCRSSVHDWLNGSALPRKENYELIYQVTKGAVTPSDFYNLVDGNNISDNININLTHNNQPVNNSITNAEAT